MNISLFAENWRLSQDMFQDYGMQLIEFSDDDLLPNFVGRLEYRQYIYKCFFTSVRGRIMMAESVDKIDKMPTARERDDAREAFIKAALARDLLQTLTGNARRLLRVSLFAMIAPMQKVIFEDSYLDFCQRLNPRARQYLVAHEIHGIVKLPEVKAREEDEGKSISSITPFSLAWALTLVETTLE